jgi:hypothetical protein
MKKFIMGLLCFAMCGLSTVPAWAVPAFSEAFKKKYVEGNGNQAFVDAVAGAKCNVCHMGEKKKDKNEYGKAVGKFLMKGDFAGDSKKYDPKSEEGMKVLAEGLDKAAAEKSSGGMTYGELIKAGKLPGGN